MKKLYQVAEISVAYSRKNKGQQTPTIESSNDAFQVLKEFFSKKTLHLQEQFVVIYLNQSNLVIGAYRSSIGGITGTVADIRLILGVALKVAATGIILSHNHPSGNLVPSSSDKQLTEKITEACKWMDLKLLDHIIIGSEASYTSFADEGWI